MESNINDLSDGILVNVLSFLDMKEAARTSVVSHRWRDLWTYSTYLWFVDLDKDGTKKGPNPKYLDIVNHVLDVHKGSRIDYLKIQFESLHSTQFSTNVQCSLDNWVDFAITKRTRCLELNLYPSPTRVSPYRFPTWLLDIPTEFRIFDRLCVLSMNSLSISDQELQRLLSACVGLKKLSISHVGDLHQVKVVAPELKILEIRFCSNLSRIDIVAPNLKVYKHLAVKCDDVFSFKGSPQLSSVYLSGTFCQKDAFWSELRNTRIDKLELEMYEECLKHGSGISNVDGRDRDGKSYTNPSLRVVEFVCWTGLKHEVQLASDIMDIATNLQRVTFFLPKSWEGKDHDQQEAELSSAKELIRQSHFSGTSNGRFEELGKGFRYHVTG